MKSSNDKTPEQLLDAALDKLLEWENHHSSMVLYSEAKVLHRTVPWLIDLLELGKKFLSSSAVLEDGSIDPDDIYACREFIGLAKAILEEN
jgi:hypothetical protein